MHGATVKKSYYYVFVLVLCRICPFMLALQLALMLLSLRPT